MVKKDKSSVRTLHLYFMVEFGIFLLNLVRCEDFDVDQDLSVRKGLVVPLVPQSDLSQAVPHAGQPHRSLSDHHLLAKFVPLVDKLMCKGSLF